MWTKIKEAFAEKWAQAKTAWVAAWTSFKPFLINFVYALFSFIYALILTAIWLPIGGFCVAAGRIIRDWLVALIEKA